MQRLAERAYRGYVERIGREPAPMSADHQAIAAGGRAQLLWVGDVLVGMIVLESEADALLIENIAVDPDHQGSGVGAWLLELAERRARASGLAVLRLYTNEAKTENLDYYPRRGFHEVRRASEDGFRRVWFEKTLT